MVNRLNTAVSVGSGTAGFGNLVDKDLTNAATFINGVSVGTGDLVPSITIKDVSRTYAQGTTAGFVVSVDASLIKLKTISLPMRIYFYKDGKQVGYKDCVEKSGSALQLTVANISKDTRIEFTAQSDWDFDEIGICYTGSDVLSADVISALKIYYAFVGKNGKYYLDTEENVGIEAYKQATGFTGDITLSTWPTKASDLIDDDPNNSTLHSTILDLGNELDVCAYSADGLPFKKGMEAGVEYGSGGIKVLSGSSVKLYNAKPTTHTVTHPSGYEWDEVNSESNFSGSLVDVNLGAEKTTKSVVAEGDFNAIGLKSGVGVNLGATVVYRMFVVLPPSIDEDPNLTVTADRSLCDEQQTVTLNSTEPVTWECTTTPERAQKPTLKNAADSLSCTVSGFVNAGDYVFTATAADGRKATTKVTYGVGPVINTAIRPWVNNFTEKGVSYSANADQYKKWYKLNSFALIPEIVTDTANLVTPSLDDYAKAGGISLASKKMLSCVFRSQPYQSDEKVTVGFVARTKWTALNLNLLNGLKVKVYNAGAEVTKVSSENTHFKVLSAGLIDGQNYVTTQYSVEIDANTSFDAITLWDNGLLGANLSEMDIYYAFVEPSTLAQTYKNKVSQSWQTITHSATGASIDASKLGTYGTAKVADAIEDLTNIIDDDNNNCATLAGLVNAAGNKTVAVKLGRKFEGGHQVKFIVGNQEWLNVGLLNFITLKAYCDGKTDPVATKTNWDVLSLNVIGGDNKEAEILWTPFDDKTKKPVDFDEISISFTKVAGVADVVKLYGIQVANDADGDGIIDANDDESCDNPYLIDENESKLSKNHDFVHGKLNLRRYMKPDLATFSKGQWFSICLPVDLTFNQFVKTFGNNAVLAKPMHFIDGHAGTLVFNIDAVYGNNVLLHKDTPYIIKLADPQNFQKVDNSLETELETNNDNVTAATSKVDSVYIIQGVDYSMTENSKLKTETILCVHSTPNTGYPSVVWQGTYVAPTVLDKGYYTLNNGYITHYTQRGNSHFRGLRCWMYEVNGSSEAKQFDVNIFGNTEDLTTAIRDIEATTAVVNGNIYSIDGQLVRANATSTANLPMGIYIWNHKKIVIK